MALVNRDKDQSEQREVYQTILKTTASGISAGIANPGVATGTTSVLCQIPYPSTLTAVEESVWGLSGTPTHSLWIYRFAGGFTSIQIGASLNPTAFGTSGALAHSLYAAATFPLQTGDLLALYALGTNAAVAEADVTVVIRALQDIKTDFGV